MKVNLLRGKMVANGYTVETAAKCLGMSRNTLSSKINGKSEFNADEVIRLCELLHIDDPAQKVEIFLS